MKTIFSLIMVILGLAVASAFAQTQTTTSSNTTYIETSKFIGRPVKSAQGDEIGTVKDIVLDRNTGCLAYTVLSTRRWRHAGQWRRQNGCRPVVRLFAFSGYQRSHGDCR
jgi:sporulation protein YlmC with PRC-barrel domain